MAYYFDNDESVKSCEKTIKVNIKNKLFTFKTDNNVFSKKGLDFGTRSLLESLDYLKIKGNILDIGCGYGPIGIIISALTNLKVDMSDVNLRAIDLAKKNAFINDVKVNVFKSETYENINKQYDYIITNPPIRVGKKVLYKILFEANGYLKGNGHLILVINKSQGAKSTIKDLQNIYKVEILKKNKGFYVIDCQKLLTI